jgi:heme-degrading monooxygenase HmoA
MHARVTTLQMDPSRIDQAVAELEEEELPRWREIAGFKGFTLLVDRPSGKVIGTSYWESAEKMRASDEAIRPGRERAARTGGAAGPPQVELYEVAIDVET